MLTYKGLRYNGADQDFVRKILEDLTTVQAQLAQLLAQSKTQTRIKP